MERFLKARFTFLLVSLIALAMITSFMEDRLSTRFLFDFLFCFVLLSAIWSVTGRLRVFMISLALFSFATTAALYVGETPVIAAAAIGADIVFFFFATGALSAFIIIIVVVVFFFFFALEIFRPSSSSSSSPSSSSSSSS